MSGDRVASEKSVSQPTCPLTFPGSAHDGRCVMPTRKKISFVVTQTNCFEVISHRPDRCGYTNTYANGIKAQTHRIIWEECFGFIPDNMCVCHHCDNPPCINPEHLFIGTRGDNNHDRSIKKRSRKIGMRGERHPRAKITYQEVLNIRNRYIPFDAKNGCRAMAREFGLSHTSVEYIIHNKNWKYSGELK